MGYTVQGNAGSGEEEGRKDEVGRGTDRERETGEAATRREKGERRRGK